MWKGYLSILAAGLIVAAGTVGAWGADNATPTTEPADVAALRAEVKELRSEVQDMKERHPDASVYRPDIDEAKAATLEDAQLHSEMGDFSPARIGWTPDRGLDIRTDDGKFGVAPFFLFQTRYAANYHQATGADGGTSTQDGFEIRRMQLGVDGLALVTNHT
jgi:hypothetical protein